MLSQLEVATVLPARDLGRVKAFFADKLGLEPTVENERELRYRTSKGSGVLIYETANAGTAQNTALLWVSDDVRADVARLRQNGVAFEEYDQPGLKTENGIAANGGELAAWFKDSEGNIHCIAQDG